MHSALQYNTYLCNKNGILQWKFSLFWTCKILCCIATTIYNKHHTDFMSIIFMLISMRLGLNSFYFSLDWKDYFFISITSRQTHKNIKGHSGVPRGKKKMINVEESVFWSDLLKAVSEFLWISVYIFWMCKLCLLFFKVLLFQMLISAKKLIYPQSLLFSWNFAGKHLSQERSIIF